MEEVAEICLIQSKFIFLKFSKQQPQQFLSGQNSQNNLNPNNNNNKTNNQFDPISEAKNNKAKVNQNIHFNKTKSNKANETNKSKNLKENKSSPSIISNQILGSSEKSKNFLNLESKNKNKLGKAGI